MLFYILMVISDIFKRVEKNKPELANLSDLEAYGIKKVGGFMRFKIISAAEEALSDYKNSPRGEKNIKKIDSTLKLAAATTSVIHACGNSELEYALNKKWHEYAHVVLRDTEEVRNRIQTFDDLLVASNDLADTLNLQLPKTKCAEWMGISNALLEDFSNQGNDEIMQRCKKLMGKHGWTLVKACVDEEIKAKKALEKY